MERFPSLQIPAYAAIKANWDVAGPLPWYVSTMRVIHSGTCESHSRYLDRCRELALQSAATGDAQVGSLIVMNGIVIAESSERVRGDSDVTAHAEIAAIRKACAAAGTLDLTGSTLYTTVDPCIMCAYAIRLARVSTVVSMTPEPGTDGRLHGMNILVDESAVPNRPVPSIVRIPDC